MPRDKEMQTAGTTAIKEKEKRTRKRRVNAIVIIPKGTWKQRKYLLERPNLDFSRQEGQVCRPNGASRYRLHVIGNR
jgi:hypothetical protein